MTSVSLDREETPLTNLGVYHTLTCPLLVLHLIGAIHSEGGQPKSKKLWKWDVSQKIQMAVIIGD